MINKKLVYIICSFTAIVIVGIIFSSNVMADNVDYDVNIAPSIMVSIPTDTVTLNLNPFVSAFGSTDLAVTVGTNNPTGYTLTMSPSDDTTTSLTRTGGTETIPTLDDLSGGYTEQTFTTNKWGYKLSSTNYLPFATSNEIAVTDAPTNATTSTVTFATKADTTLVSGAYNLEITFTAVANYVPPAVTYMQNLDPTLCTTSAPTTVVDSRDNEEYLVQRLADGKCWMVENLNLAGGTSLDESDTDVTSEYIASYSAGSSRLEKSNNKLVLPASATKNDADDNLTDSSQFSTNNYSYVYNSGNKTGCGASGQNTPCYSYYSWDAATLGSGRTIATDNTDAPYSICPKGWKLPSTYNGTDTTAAEAADFRKLMANYGGSLAVQTYNSSSTPTGATMYGNIGPNSTTPNFLLAGYYYNGSFLDGGSDGSYWSSTSSSSTNAARILYFDSSYVYSAGYDGRSGGFSVRCLLAE